MRGPHVVLVGTAVSGRARVRGSPGVAGLGAPLAMAALALACGAATPAHALELYDLSAYAEYSPETGTIRLTPFAAVPNPGVDWSSIDMSKMRLVGCAADGDCADIPLSVRVAADMSGNILELSPDGGAEALADAASLTIVIGEGAYKKADGGDNVPLSVYVVMPGDRSAVLLEGALYDYDTDHIYLYFSDAVDPASVDWSRMYVSGISFHDLSQVVRGPMPDLEPAAAGGDGKVASFALGPHGRNVLLSVWQPVLHAAPGAYRDADGAMGLWDVTDIGVPDIAYMGTVRLASAEYAADDNRLYMRFGKAVDPSSIRPDRIFIEPATVPEPALRGIASRLDVMVPSAPPRITMSWPEFVGFDDLQTVVFELSESNRYELSRMPHPVVFLEERTTSMARGMVELLHPNIVLVHIVGEEFFPPNPDIPAALPVHSVDYGGIDGRITLHFREPIDPSSINASRITISGSHPCLEVALEDGDLAGVAADGMSATFELDMHKSRTLMLIGDTQMSLERGAFETAGGVPVPDGRFPFPDDPARTYGDSHVLRFSQEWLPCRITYAVEPPVHILERYGFDPDRYLDRLMSSVYEGLAVWSELNPGLTLERVDGGTADLEVRWRVDSTSISCSCLYPGANFELALVWTHLPGGASLTGPGGLANTVAHEFGHNLGLRHYKDPGHLMTGRHGIEEPYNDLGLNIPDRHWWRPGG